MDRSSPVGGDALIRRPGDPVSAPLNETNAPLTPATLTVESVGSGRVVLPRPVVLSNVAVVGLAEGHAGHPVSARVEEIDGVAAGAQPHAGTTVSADGQTAGHVAAEPRRCKGADVDGRRTVDEDH